MTKDPRAEPESADESEDLTQPEEQEGKPEPRSTLVPAFDVATFAKAVDVTQPRSATVTITNETELEEARRASMQSSLPPARKRAHSDAELELGTVDVAMDDLRLSTPGELRPRGEETPPSQANTSPPPAPDPDIDPALVLGDLKQVPKLLVGPDDLASLALDHHAGFMLALVDSVLSYDTILDVCGMPRKDAMMVLAKLVIRQIIGT